MLELPDSSWSGHTPTKKRKRKSPTKSSKSAKQTESAPYTGPITRSRAKAKLGTD